MGVSENLDQQEETIHLTERPLAEPLSVPEESKKSWRTMPQCLSWRVTMIPLILSSAAVYLWAQNAGLIGAAIAAVDPSINHYEKYRRYYAVSSYFMQFRCREFAPIGEFFAERAIRETEVGFGVDNEWKRQLLLCTQSNEGLIVPPDQSKIDSYATRKFKCVELLYGPRSREWAACLAELASFRQGQGKRNEALAYWWLAIRTRFIAESFFGDHDHVNSYLYGLQQSGSKFSLSQISEKPLPQWVLPPEIGRTLGDAAQAYAAYNKPGEAEQLFKQSLDKAKRLDQHGSFGQQVLATVQNRYAGFLRYQGRLSEAVKLEQEVDTVRATLYPALMAPSLRQTPPLLE